MPLIFVCYFVVQFLMGVPVLFVSKFDFVLKQMLGIFPSARTNQIFSRLMKLIIFISSLAATIATATIH